MTTHNSVPFFFKTFWPLLVWFRIIGIFPCKKVKKEDGSVSLVPVNWKIRLLSFTIWNCLILTAVFTCMVIVTNNVDVSLLSFFRPFHISQKSTIDAFLDAWIEQANIVLLMVVGTFLGLEIHRKAKEICALYDTLSRHYPISLHNEITRCRRDIKRKSVMSIIDLTICNIIFVLLFSYAIACKFKVNFNLDSTNTWLVVFGVLIFWSTFYLSQFGFYMTFGEFILALYNWTVSLKDNFDENSHELLQNAQELSSCLRMVSKLFSRCNFYGMLVWLVNLILIVYRITSLLFSDEKDVIYALAYVFMALQHLHFVHNLNCASQNMINFVQDLRKTIKHTNMTEMKVEWNGKWESTSFAKDNVVENLHEFQGFEGEGYFNLGKSFLSSIVTNFLTYLIILIQLKLTFMTSSFE